MSEQGWIKLHRKIRTNGLWPNEKKYSPLEAWLDLLLSANHNGNKILIDGKMTAINRGEFITSIVKLSERWGWHRNTVSKFLDMLTSEVMIEKKCTAKYTSITIVKYEVYQSECTTESAGSVQEIVHQNVHKQECKELKNDKKINKIIPPELEWVKKYCEERQNGVNSQKWFDHYESNGWMVGKTKMKDWQAAVRKWENSDYKQPINQQVKLPTKPKQNYTDPMWAELQKLDREQSNE